MKTCKLEMLEFTALFDFPGFYYKKCIEISYGKRGICVDNKIANVLTNFINVYFRIIHVYSYLLKVWQMIMATMTIYDSLS